MFYSTTTNTYIQEGTAFEINGVQYPQNWLNLSTPQEKAEIGLEEVIATNSPANQQYYWVSQELNGASLTYINNPKDLDTCKTNAVSQLRNTAYTMLLPTDWMVVKSVETSTPIPSDWNTWRASIRTTCENAITAVNACTNVDELAQLSVTWPNDPNYVTPVQEAQE
jgi:hypothetical protein